MSIEKKKEEKSVILSCFSSLSFYFFPLLFRMNDTMINVPQIPNYPAKEQNQIKSNHLSELIEVYLYVLWVFVNIFENHFKGFFP